MTKRRGVQRVAVDLKQRTVPTTLYTSSYSMTLRRGEVALIRIDYHQTPGGKIRPATVLLDSGDDDFVAAPITSRPRRSDFDIVIGHWREAGLNVASTIRIHKLTVLAKDDIVRRLGDLVNADRGALAQALRDAFSLDQ
jgi:mRNA interferase MazF